MTTKLKASDTQARRGAVPSSFSMSIRRLQPFRYELTASQVLPLPKDRVFAFFEDPKNLSTITPDWLQFVMMDKDQKVEVLSGSEFDYTIKWFGVPMRWRSRIEDYRPPEVFSDIQVAGPYRTWRHQHTFHEAAGGTLMLDTVEYRLPLGPLGNLVHAIAVKRQLEDIFRYRAVRVEEWAQGGR